MATTVSLWLLITCVWCVYLAALAVVVSIYTVGTHMKLLTDCWQVGKLRTGNTNGTTASWIESVVMPYLQVRKSSFTHFYACGLVWNLWLAMELGQVVLLSSTHRFIPILSMLQSPSFTSRTSIGKTDPWLGICTYTLCTLLLIIQIAARLYECLYQTVYSDSYIHVAHYVVGVTFYILAPLSYLAVAFPAILHTNDTEIYSAYVPPHITTIPYVNICMILIGIVCYYIGFIHQRRCHSILAILRHGVKNDRISSTYSIPHGDWFSYVSSPHYLAEIVIYIGLFFISSSCMTDISLYNVAQGLPAALVFVFTACNLSFIAHQTHMWYHEKFKTEYPNARSVIIPFVF